MSNNRNPNLSGKIDPNANFYSFDGREMQTRLDVDFSKGLSTEEAAKRLEIYGPNELEQEEPMSLFARIMAQFDVSRPTP